MQYIIVSGPQIDTDGKKPMLFRNVIAELMKEGWRPQGGIAMSPMTKRAGYDSAYYLAQAMVHDDDNAEIPQEIGMVWVW
jgi:hypothetical protein